MTTGKNKADRKNIDPSSVKKALVALQANSGVVSESLRRSNKALYEHLSKLYLWWRRARDIDGYLEAEYTKLGRNFRSVNYGMNLGPLVWLGWSNTGINNDYVDKYSRALNSLHQEYKAKADYYRKDTITKLASFMEQSGGVSGLAGYGSPAEVSARTQAESSKTADDVSDPEISDEDWAKFAKNHYVEHAAMLPDIGSLVPPDNEQFSLALMAADGATNRQIALCLDPTKIDALVSQAYREDFSALPVSLRPLLELMQTQCLPTGWVKHVQRQKAGKKFTGFKREAFVRDRRLAYLKDSGQFLLSPVNAESGVVSMITPTAEVFIGPQHDMFLPPCYMGTLESGVLRGFEFNSYSAKDESALPQRGANSMYSLQLSLRAAEKATLHVPFLSFSDDVSGRSGQLCLCPDYDFTPIWAAKFPSNWRWELRSLFCERWMGGHGRHITRAGKADIGVSCNAEQLQFHFIRAGEEFDQFEQFAAHEVTTGSVSDAQRIVEFAAADLMPVLFGVSTLPIDGDISIAVADDALILRCNTQGSTGATHEIIVPALDSSGQRITTPFSRFNPGVVTTDEPEGYRWQEEAALDWLEGEEVGL